MTHFNTAFSASSKTDSAFDDLTASLGDARPHPTEDALIQLGRALMTELVDVISDTAGTTYTVGMAAPADATPAGATAAEVQTAIEATRKGGHVTLIGNLAPQVDFPLQSVVTRELTLHGTCGSNGEYPECIDLLASGTIQVEPLISAKATLEEGPDWFERLYTAEKGFMKVILQPEK